jgi:hypothetical protein
MHPTSFPPTHRRPAGSLSAVLGAALLAGLVGCGTTKWSDTSRTATEQLLISDAMDRAISKVDLRALAGKEIYLDASPLGRTVDSDYLVSSLRQHMLASGCILKEKREEAEYVLELRAGAVGTDRRELLVGVPATKVPDVVPVPGVPRSIPEVGLIKKTEQRGVAKIAMFAYNRKTGRPVWQSDVIPVESKAKDIWFLGAGPFQQGTIYEGTKFAGDEIEIPLIDPYLIDPYLKDRDRRPRLSVAQEAYFSEPHLNADQTQIAGSEPAGGKADATKSPGKPGPKAARPAVVPASHEAPAKPSKKTPDPPKKKPASGAKPPKKPSDGQPAPPPAGDKTARKATETKAATKPGKAADAKPSADAKPPAKPSDAEPAAALPKAAGEDYVPPFDPFDEPSPAPGGRAKSGRGAAGDAPVSSFPRLMPLRLPEIDDARPIPLPRDF